MAFAAENARKQCSDGRFHAQNALTQLHGRQACLAQQVDFVRNPATFGADGQGHGLVHGARAGRVRAGVTDQAQGTSSDRGQAVFDERLEALLDDYLGQYRVAGLFQAEDQVVPNAFRLQERRLPEAFLDLVAVQQDQPRYTQGSHGLEQPAQHLRAGYSQHQGQRQFGRRLLVEGHLQLGLVRCQAQHRGLAHQAVDAAHPQLVADRHAVDFLHVGEAPVSQHHAVGRNEVGLFKQQQVHG